MKKNISVFVAIFFLCGCSFEKDTEPSIKDHVPAPVIEEQPKEEVAPEQVVREITFSDVGENFLFFGSIPESWSVAYDEQSDAVNIFDAEAEGETNLEKSQIFIRQFEGDDFLTLDTVEIGERREHTVNEHAAVSYDITKKSTAPDFPNQPKWRNAWHTVTDVRYQKESPSRFYVFAKNPDLPEETFQSFIASLQFFNDTASVRPPMKNHKERVTKKPFGIVITPATSPVQPERFSGIHTGVDYEVTDDELDADISVQAICGGTITQMGRNNGYGGTLVQKCSIGEEVWHVVYGHLDASRFPFSRGAFVAPGQTLGFLGAHESTETDGERKHLHLGVNTGEQVDLRGYVQSKSSLDKWIDISTFIDSDS